MNLVKEQDLCIRDLITNTGYSRSSVLSWTMTNRESARARPVPDRAVEILKLRLSTGNILKMERRRRRSR